jgi:hypothetical protein
MSTVMHLDLALADTQAALAREKKLLGGIDAALEQLVARDVQVALGRDDADDVADEREELRSQKRAAQAEIGRLIELNKALPEKISEAAAEEERLRAELKPLRARHVETEEAVNVIASMFVDALAALAAVAAELVASRALFDQAHAALLEGASSLDDVDVEPVDEPLWPDGLKELVKLIEAGPRLPATQAAQVAEQDRRAREETIQTAARNIAGEPPDSWPMRLGSLNKQLWPEVFAKAKEMRRARLLEFKKRNEEALSQTVDEFGEGSYLGEIAARDREELRGEIALIKEDS